MKKKFAVLKAVFVVVIILPILILAFNPVNPNPQNTESSGQSEIKIISPYSASILAGLINELNPKITGRLVGFEPFIHNNEKNEPQSAYSLKPQNLEILVTSKKDSGPGSLRAALENARPGTVIRFDPLVFPVDSPAVIQLESDLPDLHQGKITIDAQEAGVILDGTLMGNELQQAFLDDIHLSIDGGENILKNGDFNSDMQLDHWIFWQFQGGDTYQWNGEIGDGSFEWHGRTVQDHLSLVYQTLPEGIEKIGDGNEWFDSGRYAYLPVDGGQSLSLNFRYRYGNINPSVKFLTADYQKIDVSMDEGLPFSENWQLANFSIEIPVEAQWIVLEFHIFPYRSTSGLFITSNENTILGLEIKNFTGNGITIIDGYQNRIGRANPWLESGCGGPCNLLSGNAEAGIYIEKGGENIIQGNYMGVDGSGTIVDPNGLGNVRIFDSGTNQIGGRISLGEGNLLSGSTMGVEINQEWDTASAKENTVQGNLIGTNHTGAAPLGNQIGISLAGSSYTLIGGEAPDLRNIISGNESGVFLSRNAHHNSFIGNHIGVDLSGDLALGNVNDGINLGEGAHDNQIGPGNRIFYNGGSGISIFIDSELNGNRITENAIAKNQGLGINVWQNDQTTIPEVADWVVTSRSVDGRTTANALVEIYQDDEDQGEVFLGSVLSNEEGDFHWVSSAGQALDQNITVLVTDAAGSSSFSNPEPVPAPFLKELPGSISPQQISLSLNVILTNTIIAIFALLFFGIVATWFNESLESFSKEITLKIREFLTKIGLIRVNQKTTQPAQYKKWIILLKWLIILGVTAFIQTFLDPEIKFNLSLVGQIATIVLSGLFITGLQIFTEWLLRRMSPEQPDVKETEVSFIGLVMAALSVAFSRLMQFSPGLVLGTVDGLYWSPELDDVRQNGQRALAAKGMVFGITFIGWLLSPLFKQNPGIQALLITMFVVGIQYAFFELIPLKVLDGYAVRCWNKWIWRLAFLTSTIGFVYLCINPDIGDLSAIQDNSMQTLLIMAGGLLLASLALHVFVRNFQNEAETDKNSDTAEAARLIETEKAHEGD